MIAIDRDPSSGIAGGLASVVHDGFMNPVEGK